MLGKNVFFHQFETFFCALFFTVRHFFFSFLFLCSLNGIQFFFSDCRLLSLALQEVKFHTYENSSTHIIERDAIAEIETRGCYSQQKQAYIVDILVPPTPPSDSTASKIVCVSYSLIVSYLIFFLAACLENSIFPVVRFYVTTAEYFFFEFTLIYIKKEHKK